MLTPLSVLSLDQGPKWREPAAEAAPVAEPAPAAAPSRLRHFIAALVARVRRPVEA